MTVRSLELEEFILGKIADGQSLRSICSAADMPDRVTVMRWMLIDPEFATRCAHARVMQADALEDDMGGIEDRTLRGEIDPAAARVVLSSKQWRASKLAPKKYGDKLELDHKGGVTVKLETGDDAL